VESLQYYKGFKRVTSCVVYSVCHCQYGNLY